MTCDDIVMILEDLDMLEKVPPPPESELLRGSSVLSSPSARPSSPEIEYRIVMRSGQVSSLLEKAAAKGYLTLRPNCLKWTPFILARTWKRIDFSCGGCERHLYIFYAPKCLNSCPVLPLSFFGVCRRCLHPQLPLGTHFTHIALTYSHTPTISPTPTLSTFIFASHTSITHTHTGKRQ